MQVMVNAESYKARIYDLAVAAAGELTQKACTAKPLWIFEEDRETETLNVPEYKRRFESLDSTLEEVIRLLSVGEPNELSSELSRNAKLLGKYGKEPDLMHLINGHQTAFKTEASRETEIVPMNPINIVDVLIDVVGSCFHPNKSQNSYVHVFIYELAHSFLLCRNNGHLFSVILSQKSQFLDLCQVERSWEILMEPCKW